MAAFCVPVPNNWRGGDRRNNGRGSLVAFRRVADPRPYRDSPSPAPNNHRGTCPGLTPDDPALQLLGIDLVPLSQMNFWALSANLGAGGVDGLLNFDPRFDGTNYFPGGSYLPPCDGANCTICFYWAGVNGFEQGVLAAVVPGNPVGQIGAAFGGSDLGTYRQRTFAWPTIDGKPIRWLTCEFSDTAESARVDGGPFVSDRNFGVPSLRYQPVPPESGSRKRFRIRPFWPVEDGCADSPW